MKKFILGLFILIIIGGVSYVLVGNGLFSERVVDSAKIVAIHGGDSGRVDIAYETDDEEFQSYFDPQLRDSLDWVKENIKDSVFLSWWDYGHMIRGYTGNEVVIYSPSKDILWSLSSGKWDEEGSGKFSSKEDINDVALALTAMDSNNTKEIMQKHSADYIFVTMRDIDSSFILFRVLGLTDFLDGEYSVNDRAEDTLLFRMIDRDDIENFELVYSDDVVRVYGLDRE